ncbi:MAG: hypothetical protein JWM47_1215 [Acidimicrobiales bacterium]|nr:hypothetical protein [Acidimicrobiales bacterium]
MALTMIVAAIGQAELWPITSFRLFSQSRTGVSVTYVLVAEDAEGRPHPVTFGPEEAASTASPRQLLALASLPPARQRSLAVALVDRARVDPGGFDPHESRAVRVERVTLRADIDGGPTEETRRRVLARVELE